MLARAALRTCVCRRPEFPLLALVAGSGTRRLFFTCALGSRMRAKVFPEPGLDSRGWHGYMRASVGLAGRGCVAQLVEQLTLNQRVHSSILCTPTNEINYLAYICVRGGSLPDTLRTHHIGSRRWKCHQVHNRACRILAAGTTRRDGSVAKLTQ